MPTDHVRLEVIDAHGALKASASCEVGDVLLDACDEVRAGVPFGCRNASCGSCVVEVIAGDDALDPPSRLEASVLLHHRSADSDRLACRAVFRAPGLVRVRARRSAPT